MGYVQVNRLSMRQIECKNVSRRRGGINIRHAQHATHVIPHSGRRLLADGRHTSDTKDGPQPRFQKESISSVFYAYLLEY